MLQITPQMRILVAVEPADFRKGIDGLVRLCKDSLQEDPFGGAVFVFRNRRGTAIKVLPGCERRGDGQGFWLCHKRLSEGRFRWWPSASGQDVPGQDVPGQDVPGQDVPGQDARAKVLAAHQLSVLFSAGDPDRTSAAPDWRSVGHRACRVLVDRSGLRRVDPAGRSRAKSSTTTTPPSGFWS